MAKEFETLETKIVRSIIKRLRKQVGGVWKKIHGGPYQDAGISDIVGCLGGRYIALEVKRPSKRSNTTDLQEAFLEEIRQNGGCAAVVCSPDEAIDVLRDFFKNLPTTPDES